MILTRDNYYTPEADWAYMSCSQYQGWCECEARQMAKMQGRWVEEPREAFLVGNYFHSYFESPEAHEAFCRENAGKIYKTKTVKGEIVVTGKYAPYVQADQMIQTAEGDPLIRSLIDMPGENEIVMTGTLFGVPWRVRMDRYVPNGRLIIDYKTVANINELKWDPVVREKVTFLDAYGYMMRAAVYSEIEKQTKGKSTDPHFIIIAISKQDPPDKDVLELNHRQRYDYELAQIKDRLPHIQRVKEGRERPTRCGYCDYCRATKRLFAIRPYFRLMPEFRERREEDYASDYAEGGEGPLLADAPEAGAVDGVPSVRQAYPVAEDGR